MGCETRRPIGIPRGGAELSQRCQRISSWICGLWVVMLWVVGMFHLDIVIDSAVMYERLSFLTYLIRLCWHHCLQQIPVRPTQLHFYELISQLWWIKRLVWHWFIVIKVHLWILQGDNVTPQVLFQHVPEETG